MWHSERDLVSGPISYPTASETLGLSGSVFCVCADRWLGVLGSLSLGTGCQGNQPVIRGMALSASPGRESGGGWWSSSPMASE